jgi:hypothetical protein
MYLLGYKIYILLIFINLFISGVWANTSTGERLLLHDNGGDEERVIIFATEKSLKLLAESDTWFMDGNFDLAPKLFLQLYIIRAKHMGMCVTGAFCLLQRKTQRTYEHMLHIIVEECAFRDLYLDPLIFHVDFERAAINAIKSTFRNNVDIRGCYYHLTQSTHRKIQSLGLKNLYKNDEQFSSFCAMVDATAFLPVADVPLGMDFLKQMAEDSRRDAEKEVFEYFESTYVKGPFRALRRENVLTFRRLPPLFPPEEWNVRQATINNSERTNNETEGYNHRLKNIIGHSHPGVFSLIKIIRQEFIVDETKIQHAALGHVTRKKKTSKYEKTQNLLRNLCISHQRGEKSLEEFLKAIGHTIRFK